MACDPAVCDNYHGCVALLSEGRFPVDRRQECGITVAWDANPLSAEGMRKSLEWAMTHDIVKTEDSNAS